MENTQENSKPSTVEWKDGELYIEGLHYKFPKKPAKKDIRNHNLPKNKQKWSRRLDEEQFDWSDGWEDRINDNPEQVQFVLDEVERIVNGEWVYINGEATYLNGDAYFFLQHFILEDSGEYPDFRDTVLIYYRFTEIVDNTRLCTGDALLKGRRLGATSMVMSRKLRKSLLSRNKNFGITSKTGADAEGAFSILVNAFQNLKPYLKPQIEGNDAPKKVLSMKKQSERIKKGQKTTGNREGLNNKILWRSTAMNTFDSGAYEYILVDECLAPDTKIMMGDGTFREIDTIKVGDYVMTEGSIPRRVMKRFDGYDNMYTVFQKHGINYSVNSKHRIIFEHRMGGGDSRDGEYLYTPLEYFKNFTKSSKRVIQRVTSKGVEFKPKNLIIDPYILGAWLGDGFSCRSSFVVNKESDTELIEYIYNYFNKKDYWIKVRDLKNTTKAVVLNISPQFKRELEYYNLINNKHIPQDFINTSIKDRLELLAGIIDTDGYYKKGSFSIGMSRRDLISQIRLLALSCGLDCSLVQYKKSNLNTDVYTIFISGNLNVIPTKISRKSTSEYNQHYKSRRNQVYIGSETYFGRYVGIQVKANSDSERRLILEDFTLTMNCGKFPADVPIDKYLAVVTKCVKKGAKVTGKLSLPSTVNPPHLGGANYRVVWNGSDQMNADYLGQTKTGLYRIMIPAYFGFAGYIDEFGNSVVENPTPEQTKYLESTGECPDPTIGAKQYLELVRKNLESDPEALQEEIRMNPFNAEEVFETSNNRCLFDLKALNEQLGYLEEKLLSKGKNPLKDELGRRGWFHKAPNGRVHFVDDPNGLWYVDKLLSEEESNKFHINSLGKQVPDNEVFGAGGGDPVASGDATVDKGSDSCLIIRSRYSSLDPENTGVPVAMFLGRMLDVTKLYEQWYNGLIYYGVKMLAERAPITWLTYAENNNLEEYIYGTKRSDGTEVKGIVGQQTVAVKDEHAEVQVLSSLHDNFKIPFARLVRDRKSFSVNNRTDYDACMADGYALLAMKIPVKQVRKRIVKENSFVRVGKITQH